MPDAQKAADSRPLSEKRPVTSFDIFDTLLTLRAAHPKDLFGILRNRSADLLGPGIPVSEFVHHRVRAERKASEHAGGADPDLEAIYRELQSRLDLNEESCARLLERERALHSEYLAPVPRGLELLRREREKGRRIVYLSDMYLPAEQLREELRRAGAWRDGDTLYVSAEADASKREGTLYQQLLRDAGLPRRHIRHIGDNKRTDGLQALKNGIRPTYFGHAKPNRREKILAGDGPPLASLGSLLAGASRMRRLRLETEAPSRERDRTLLTHQVIAPFLVSFVLHTLRQARANGHNRLYFLARDGYILHRIAQALEPAVGGGLRCHYLYASRQAWQIASIRSIDADALQFILQPHNRTTLRQIAFRLHLSPEQLREHLRSTSLHNHPPDSSLGERERRELREQIKESTSFQQTILDQAAEARRRTLAYFRQEGLRGRDWAFVDVGWKGSLQTAFTRIVETETEPYSYGYYIGTLPPTEPADPTRNGWLFDAGNLELYHGFPEILSIVESFCSAPQGSVDHYAGTTDKEKVEPVFRAGNHEALLAFGIEHVIREIDAYAALIARGLPDFDPREDMRPAMQNLLVDFIGRPGRGDVAAWGVFPYENNPSESEAPPTLAAPVPFRPGALWQCLRYGRTHASTFATWRAASLRMTRAPLRQLCGILMAPANFARRNQALVRLSRALASRKYGSG